MMLEHEPDIEVVGEAGSGAEALDLARRTDPDIVCMDIGMSGINGIEATEQLLAIRPQVKVIGLSAYADQRFVLDMMNAGAAGYVTKSGAGDELLRAIRAVARNQNYLCPVAAAAVTDAMRSQGGRGRMPSQLGARERQVLQLVAEGYTSVRIADCLHIAPATVDVHRRNIMRKLDIHNVAELTRYALANGLTEAVPPPAESSGRS